jgi:hypothetical protein
MKVEVTVAGKPYRDKAIGDSFQVTPVEAKVLVKLGRVTYTDKAGVTVEVPPEVVEEVVKPRRVYRRRDMKAD